VITLCRSARQLRFVTHPEPPVWATDRRTHLRGWGSTPRRAGA
jgi:hypothetical protein